MREWDDDLKLIRGAFWDRLDLSGGPHPRPSVIFLPADMRLCVLLRHCTLTPSPPHRKWNGCVPARSDEAALPYARPPPPSEIQWRLRRPAETESEDVCVPIGALQFPVSSRGD